MFNNLAEDLRHGLRTLLAKPGFSLAAILTLALGIGANAAVFSVVNSMVLAPVRGVGASDRLVEIGLGENLDSLSYPDYLDIAAQTHALDSVAAWWMEPLHVRVANGEPVQSLAFAVSGSYFGALQTHAAFGRLLQPSDDDVAAPPAVVVSHAAWLKHFAGDPKAIGRPVTVNGHSFTLVGVAAAEFHSHVSLLAPEFYVPLRQRELLHPGAGKMFDERGARWLQMIGRLAPDASLSQARSQLAAFSEHRRELIKSQRARDARKNIEIGPLHTLPSSLQGPFLILASLLFVLVGMILLIGCVNVAGMLIARSELRSGEIALRFALGATRARVLRQQLIESLGFCVVASALGFALTLLFSRLPHMLDPATFAFESINLAPEIPLDYRVLAFIVAVSIATVMLSGLLPALRASSSTLRTALAGSHQVLGARTRLRGALVVVQIAFTLVLLVASGLFVRALQSGSAIDLGFQTDNIVIASIDLDPSGYDPAHQAQFQHDLLERVAQLPGVQSAGAARIVPLSMNHQSFGTIVANGIAPDSIEPNVNIVTPGFFETLGIALRGRSFNQDDRGDSPGVCVINETLARQLAADGDVLDHIINFDGEKPMRIVGIVADAKYDTLADQPQPFVFLPLTQSPSGTISLLVRTSTGAPAFTHALHDLLHALDPNLPSRSAEAFSSTIAQALLPQRIAGGVAGVLGLVGLLLAATGLYGLIAFQVAQRTREIGLRLALGATPQRVRSNVLGRSLRYTMIGLGIGLPLALAGAWLIRSLLFGTHALDLLVFAGATVALVAVALIACWLPARRAANLDPIVALRYE